MAPVAAGSVEYREEEEVVVVEGVITRGDCDKKPHVNVKLRSISVISKSGGRK